MGTSSSKNKRKAKTGSGKDRLGVKRKRSLSKKSALGWTDKAGPVMTSEKTVVWERQRKASKALTETLSTSLRYSDFNRVARMKSLETDDSKPIYIPYDSSEVFQNEPDDLCHICSVYTGGVMTTCKVCLHVYHQSCLRKIGQDGNTAKFRADGHWSCHICDDISSLLTEEEMKRLCQTLEKYNIIKGRDLLHTEILSFWKQQFLDKVASGMDLDTERRLVDVICKMDPDQRGIVTWKNFMDHEALKILNKRNKNSLLRLLTESEIRKIRNEFKLFDFNKQGFIMKDNALALLITSEAFYCVQDCGSGPTLSALGSESQVNWQQFVMMQAIYAIAARLNVWQHSNENTDHQETDNIHIKDPLTNYIDTAGGSRNTNSQTEVQMRDPRNKVHATKFPLRGAGNTALKVGGQVAGSAVPLRDAGNTVHDVGGQVAGNVVPLRGAENTAHDVGGSAVPIRTTSVPKRGTEVTTGDTGNRMCHKTNSVPMSNHEDKILNSEVPVRKHGNPADPIKVIITDNNLSESKPTCRVSTNHDSNLSSASKLVNKRTTSESHASLSIDNADCEVKRNSQEISNESKKSITAVSENKENIHKVTCHENNVCQTSPPSSCLITVVVEQGRKSIQPEVIIPPDMSMLPAANNNVETHNARDKDVEKPSVGKTDVKKPSVGNKDVEKPSVGNKDVEKPSVGNKDVEKPSVGNKDVEKPSVGKKDVEKPTVGKKDVEKPTVGKKDVEKPTVGKKDVEKPTVGNKDVEKPTVRKIDAEKPTVAKKDVEKPSVGKTDVEKPSVGKTVVEKPTVGKTDVEKPSVGNRDVEKPIVGNKDVEKLSVGKTDVEKRVAGNDKVEKRTDGNNHVEKRVASSSNTSPPRKVYRSISNGKDKHRVAQQTFTEKAQIEFIKCSSAHSHRATKSLYVLKGNSGRQGHVDLRRPVSMV